MASSESQELAATGRSASTGVEVRDKFPLEKISKVQLLTAQSFEAAYLAAGEFPELSRRIRMNAVACREQQTTVHTLVLKFRNTGNDVLDMLVPQIQEAVEEGDAELVKLNLELAIEWTVEMKTDCENTRKEYTKIRQEVNQSLAVAKSEKQKNDENTQKAKRKEEALTRERKDLAEEEKRLAELMVEMKKELENVKGRRTEAQREQQTAQTTQPTGSPGFLTTVGRLFRPSAFKSRLEMANEQLAEAQSDVFKAHDKVQELSAKIRRTQSKIIEHADNIRQIQDDKKELSDQSGDLKRASEGLGKVDFLLQICSSFWGSMNDACATMQRKLENPQKTFLKRDLAKYKKQFLKAFDGATEFWKVFVDVSQWYLSQAGSAAVAYKFLDGTVDHVSRQQRQARLAVLQREIDSQALEFPEAQSYAAIMHDAQTDDAQEAVEALATSE